MSELLTVLACGSCGSSLSGLSTDAAFLCRNCGKGWGIGAKGLFPLPTSVRTVRGEDTLPLPFWLVEADVTIGSRITRREVHNVPVQRGRWFAPGLETGLRETGGISGPRMLAFPAFSVNGVFDIGVKLSALIHTFPEEVSERWPGLAGVFSGPGEVADLARGVCIGQEASADDWLADVKLLVDLRSTTLLVLPAVVREETVVLKGTELSIFKRSITDLERITAFHRGTSR